ncbi:Stathmin-2 [Myotis brandtii]|uniref:Stathmin-2 n=1 Tax=Myotis brandtii TaxID=109478 RepID=S7NNK5_MYOBR|nr:Stathmin-2 [Myotis brandtii]
MSLEGIQKNGGRLGKKKCQEAQVLKLVGGEERAGQGPWWRNNFSKMPEEERVLNMGHIKENGEADPAAITHTGRKGGAGRGPLEQGPAGGTVWPR